MQSQINMGIKKVSFGMDQSIFAVEKPRVPSVDVFRAAKKSKRIDDVVIDDYFVSCYALYADV